MRLFRVMRCYVFILFILSMFSCKHEQNKINYGRLKIISDSIKMNRNRKFIFIEKDVNLGTLKHFQKNVVVDFPYRNTTNDNLLIQMITSSCGCMAVEYSNKVIRPRDKGEVRVRLNLESERGFFQKTAIVYFHGDKYPPVYLMVKGKLDI